MLNVITAKNIATTGIRTPDGKVIPLQDIIDALCDLADGFQFTDHDVVPQLGCSLDDAAKMMDTASALIPFWNK